MDENPDNSVRLFSFHEDQPNERRGALIPRSIAVDELVMKKVAPDTFSVGVQRIAKLTLVPVALAVFAFVFVAGFDSVLNGTGQPASPVVSVIDPYSSVPTTLEYGPTAALTSGSLFIDTHDALVDEGATFISVDLEKEIIRLFENGVLLINEPILRTAESGSWWDAPSGLYEVEELSDERFSTYAQITFPWAIAFEGNYLIHGWPRFPDGNAVGAEVTAGGIRIADDVAKELYSKVRSGTPVLIREKAVPEAEAFIYAPAASGVTAAHYLVADLQNGAVLASSGVEEPLPIASITKLMTAIVAAENIDLDTRVYAASPTFVESMIPRLRDRTSVSMYGLLQLLLLESSNEAAEVIAAEYGRADFIDEMNAKAKSLGMFDTTFADPSGLSADNQSTLEDLFALTQYIATEKEFIFEISRTGEVTDLRLDEFRDLTNFNEVETLATFTGGKIGETEAAGKTSITLHDFEVQGSERQIVVILLNATEREADVATLFEEINTRFNQ